MENKYAVPLTALEASAHVPPEQQVEEKPEPPNPDAVHEDRVAAQQMLRTMP